MKQKGAAKNVGEKRKVLNLYCVTIKAMLANNQKRNPQQHKLKSKARKFFFLILQVKSSSVN